MKPAGGGLRHKSSIAVPYAEADKFGISVVEPTGNGNDSVRERPSD